MIKINDDHEAIKERELSRTLTRGSNPSAAVSKLGHFRSLSNAPVRAAEYNSISYILVSEYSSRSSCNEAEIFPEKSNWHLPR